MAEKKKSPSKKAAPKQATVEAKPAPAAKAEVSAVMTPVEKAATRMSMAKPYARPVKRKQ